MQIISEFDETKKDKTGYFNDEDHSWTAVDITKTEHSWIRNVTSRYFAYGLAEIRDKSLLLQLKIVNVWMVSQNVKEVDFILS